MADNRPYATCGFAMVTKQPTSNNKSTTNNTSITKSINYDKQSGTTTRGTAKETYSSGDYTYRGKVGYKDEHKASSTVRVTDKTGYTEYYKEQKTTRVEFNNNVGNYSGGSYDSEFNNNVGNYSGGSYDSEFNNNVGNYSGDSYDNDDDDWW